MTHIRVCKEVFDEDYQPSNDEINDYARRIGINPDKEPHLLHIAVEGLMRALPEEWRPCFSEEYQAFYYFNVHTEASQWIHPQDAVFKKKVQEARARALFGDTSEEVDSGIIRSEDMEGGRLDKRLGSKYLAPLVGRLPTQQPNTDLKPISRVGQIRRQFDVQKVVEEAAAAPEARKPPVKGFSLTGTGSMFLKSANAKKQTTNDDSQAKATTSETPVASVNSGVKGILRDSSLTDVRSRTNPNESALNSLEDKKSVRFSLFGQDVNLNTGSATRDNAPQRPSSALNKNLNLESNSDDTSTDGDGEEVIEELENDDGEDAWTPKAVVPMEIKVIAGKSQVDSVAKDVQMQLPEMNNQIVDSQQDAKRQIVLDEENVKLQQEMSRVRTENEQKLKQFMAEEEAVLQEKREEMEINKQKSLTVFEGELEARLKTVRYEIEDSYRVSLESFRDELKQEFDEKRRAIMEEHKSSLAVLEREHATKLAQMKSQLSQEMEAERLKMREPADDRMFEKIRCEKRLLEDKYRCLKDKYVRLKTDVKLSLEKRNRRREQQINNTSESNSNKTVDTGGGGYAIAADKQRGMSEKKSLEKKNSCGEPCLRKLSQPSPQIDDTTSISEATSISQTHNRMNFSAPLGDENSDSEAAFFVKVHDPEQNRSRERKKLFGRLKSASTSRLNPTKNTTEQHGQPCTPVENLRRQLMKLEDLEDQFPENTLALDATYHLRYPFTTDSAINYGNTSSELEFFKHRIHLERDSVRRAKENLKNQRDNFRARRELKTHASGRHKDIDKIMCEDKELTEMEVSLHRTRALLGEKVIRLRHLEHSLQRLFEKESKKFNTDNKNDTTLSDLSSHSSSGFSSTDFLLSDTNQLNNNRKAGGGVHGANNESTTDILKNLEILNSEIREIWELLNKQATPSSGNYYSSELDWSFNANTPNLPLTQNPLLIGGSGLNRNFTSLVSQSPVAGQYTSTLVERTRDLRNWLRQAKQEHLLAQKHSNM